MPRCISSTHQVCCEPLSSLATLTRSPSRSCLCSSRSRKTRLCLFAAWMSQQWLGSHTIELAPQPWICEWRKLQSVERKRRQGCQGDNYTEDPAHRGFSHIAFNCDDVYAATEKLLAKGINFQKKPDEGSMKSLAFALDPDGYWIELGRGRVWTGPRTAICPRPCCA